MKKRIALSIEEHVYSALISLAADIKYFVQYCIGPELLRLSISCSNNVCLAANPSYSITVYRSHVHTLGGQA